MSGFGEDFGDYAGGGGGGGGYNGNSGGYGGGGGGGYDTGGGFSRGGNSSSASPDKKGGKEQSLQTVTPLTAKMIIEAALNPQDDTLMIDGKQVSKVVVYGRVVAIDSKETFVEYTIDDGTGIVLATKMSDRDQRNENADFIPERSYVCVHGGVRNVNNERKIICHNIRVVQDSNELTCHFLSVTFNHYQNVKGPLNDGKKISASRGGVPSGGFNSTGFGSNSSFNQPIKAGIETGMAGGMDRDSRIVHDAFASDMHTDTGLSVSVVSDLLKGQGFSLQKVKSICQLLMTEGFIYSTIDDDHFKSTGSLI